MRDLSAHDCHHCHHHTSLSQHLCCQFSNLCMCPSTGTGAACEKFLGLLLLCQGTIVQMLQLLHLMSFCIKEKKQNLDTISVAKPSNCLSRICYLHLQKPHEETKVKHGSRTRGSSSLSFLTTTEGIWTCMTSLLEEFFFLLA